VKDGTKYGIGTDGQEAEWDLIPWDVIEQSIRKLRQRIFRATREHRWNQVRSLMKLMLRSYFNLLVSVRRATQKNKGKKTAGVDGVIALTPKARWRLVRQMVENTSWTTKPSRRVHIPKTGKPGQTRPLSIPVMRDRIAQAMMKNALEPSWEARFEPNSYGFRPGRSIHDAIRHCWELFKAGGRRPWILDADIRSAFDKISHEHILEELGQVPGKELLREWLKAGYVEAEILHKTETGTAQGGIISPILLNVALHGLHKALGPAYGYVRYADDFIVCARTYEEIETAKTRIREWLMPRGLELHPEKTKIVHIDDGFNFLSFSIRRYRGKCLCKPQKEKVLDFLSKRRLWLNKHKAAKAENVIRQLNPILRGWANHYRHAVSKEVFSYVSHQIWQMLWRWCLRRHPNKSKYWVRMKYFGSPKSKSWKFQAPTKDGVIFLYNVNSMKIERHIKVAGDVSPDNPELKDYWRERQEDKKRYRKKQQTRKALPTGSDARAG
jgi:RNA-directed DNA polymerase